MPLSLAVKNENIEIPFKFHYWKVTCVKKNTQGERRERKKKIMKTNNSTLKKISVLAVVTAHDGPLTWNSCEMWDEHIRSLTDRVKIKKKSIYIIF